MPLPVQALLWPEVSGRSLVRVCFRTGHREVTAGVRRDCGDGSGFEPHRAPFRTGESPVPHSIGQVAGWQRQLKGSI
jgi:hypothetical protein